MATSQQVRTQAKQGQWSSMFPNEHVTETQSSLFVKKLLAVAISSISYLRALFPEDAFGDRCLEDVNLKILRDDNSCPEACQVIQWIKGCFDALEKKYLRAVMVGIYEDPEDPDTVIEQYTFKFAYGDGEGIDIYRNGERITTAYSEKETKKATIRLLRTIVLLSQTLSSLPDDVMMTMKLLYYDDVTPDDYNPPGFKECECDSFNFKEEPAHIKVGDVATQFHSFKLRIKTRNHDLHEETQNEKGEENVVEDEGMVPDETLSLPDGALEQSVSLYQDQLEIKNDAKKDSQDDEVPEEAKSTSNNIRSTPASSIAPDEEQSQSVKCPCGVNEDDGLMILCAACNDWQHATCFAILDPEEAPEVHYCVECAQNSSDYHCTDEKLADISDLNIIQANCLWRRSLVAVLEANRILAPNLSKRLGVPVVVATSLLKRLETEGFVKSGGKAKRFGKLVQKEVIKGRGFDKYFRYIDCDKENVEMVTEQASNMQITSTKKMGNNNAENKGSKRKSGGELVSITNKDLRFDISDSQTSQASPLRESSVKKRRKTSIAADAMCV